MDTMTLFKSENASLVLKNYTVFPLDDYKYNYSLIFTDTNRIPQADGGFEDVTRTVEISFDGDKVAYFSIYVGGMKV